MLGLFVTVIGQTWLSFVSASDGRSGFTYKPVDPDDEDWCFIDWLICLLIIHIYREYIAWLGRPTDIVILYGSTALLTSCDYPYPPYRLPFCRLMFAVNDFKFTCLFYSARRFFVMIFIFNLWLFASNMSSMFSYI